jgi:hypothetical protein
MGVNARSILRERRAARSYTGYSHGDIGDIVWTTNDGRVRSFTKGGGTSRTPNQSGGTQHSMAGWSQATSRGLCIQSHGILLSTAAGPSNRRLSRMGSSHDHASTNHERSVGFGNDLHILLTIAGSRSNPIFCRASHVYGKKNKLDFTLGHDREQKEGRKNLKHACPYRKGRGQECRTIAGYRK